MDDAKIIDLYFARDEQAIKETDLKYGKLCLRISENLLQIPEDAEECVNDAYLTVWNKIPPTRPVNFSAFICKITRNLSLKRLEKMSAQKRSPKTLLSLSELEEILPDNRMAADADEEELGRLIGSFLRKEKKLDRIIFMRKYWFFDSVEDISERYVLSQSAVKSRLFRTRNRLKLFLKKEGYEI